MKAGKIWGETEDLLKTPLIEVHHIGVKEGSVCSLHKHEFKWNLFFVIYGELAIEVHKKDYDLVDTTILETGEWTTVRPNEYHRFHAITDTEALEIYYLEPLSNDIVRANVGSEGYKAVDDHT
jgi:mannose-6-phosphate isomerase-like protein (cupin superfamily)